MSPNPLPRPRSPIGLIAMALALLSLVASAEEPTHPNYCSLDPLDEATQQALRTKAEDRAGTPADERAAAALTLAGHAIAAAQSKERACQRVFARGESRFEKELKRQTRKVTRNAGAANSEDADVRAIQQQLRDAFIADQATRLAYLELRTEDRTGADYWADRLATAHAIALDGANTQLLKELLEDHDWIDSHRFGPRISSHAWLLAQHADADPAFQREVLRRMTAYLDNGGVRARDYAYLFDRVAVNTGDLQRYGTQPERECNPDGSLSPRPLESPEQVDERRAELGMEPMADAMAAMAAMRCQ